MSNLHNDDKYIKIIESIASVAAYQVDGVASLSNEAGAIFKRSTYARKGRNSVQAYFARDGKVNLNIYLNAYYGTKVPELAYNVQQKVIQEVEHSTTYIVKNVNIHIVGIVFPD